MNNLYTFETDEAKTFFAPKGKFYIYEENILKDLKVDQIKKYLLDNEIKIINKYKNKHKELNEEINWVDGATGLGDKSLTSRSPFYNLLKIKETKHLEKIIKKTHSNFLKLLNQKDDINLYIQCWANIMRKEEQILPHSHSSNGYCYLGGHICVQTQNTHTYYVNPYNKEVFASKNEIGKITLFSNWIEHYTDKVTDNNDRITIAFDIKEELGFNHDLINDMKDHWVKI